MTARLFAALALLLALTGCATDYSVTKGVVVNKEYIPASTTDAPVQIGTGWTPPSAGSGRQKRCWRIDVEEPETDAAQGATHVTPYCVTFTEFDALNIGDPYTRITISG